MAYWDGCPELFIARSNDYQLGQADDSVLVSGTAEENIPTAAIQGTPKAGDTSVTVTLGGKIPSGSVLILRSYDADATTFETSGGAWAATQANAEAKAYVLSTKEDAMVAGRKLVALVLNNGTVMAQSQPVVITAAQTPATGTVVLNESTYTVESTQATVTVTGCEEFANGRLFVTTGSPSTDNDDGRGKLGQVAFNGAGTYTILFNTTYTKLTEGNTVQAYLYKYDSDADKTFYLSASVPVVGENETVPDAKAVLYNLGEDTSRGARVRAILAELNILAETVTAEQLNETVGHMAGLDGYEAAGEKYTGTAPDTEFMLLCNLPEALLDKFLDAMQTDGLRIDHKTVVTAYNRDMKLHELMGDISEEHDVFQALLELDRLIAQAEKLEESTYGSAPNWEKFQAALSNAKQTLSSQEPTLEQLQTAGGTLKNEYLTLTGMKEMQGDLVITLTQEADGTYILRAELKNGLADAVYQYAWSNGAQSAEITGVTAEQLHTLQVTVSADNLLGSRTAQLQVPYSPAAMAATTSNAITLRWNTPADEENRPAAKTMTVGLYQGDRLIKEQTADAATVSITLTGLSANTAYTLRIAAVSPVGRSDTQVLGVSTAKRPSGGSSSSGSSGSSYAVSVPSAKNGDVTVSPKNASKGDRVTITVKPDSGYEVGSVTVLDSKGNALKLTDKGDGKYTFTMPGGKVEVKATFVKAGETSPFVDVPADSYYFDAVKWAQKLGITNGKANGLFGSNDSCTRGQIVTFLWRAAGSPAPKGEAAVLTDVIPGSYCYDAVAWALENGITNGFADGTFGVNSTCTRGQSVTFLYRALGTAPTTVNGFTDVAVGDFYAEAVAWAVENGVTNGTTDSTFSPSNGCTRAQIVTFLFRTYNQ